MEPIQQIARFVERKIRREGIPIPQVAISDVTIPRGAEPPALPRTWIWQEVSAERSSFNGVVLRDEVTLSARWDFDAAKQVARDVWVARLTRRFAKSQSHLH